MAKVYILTYTNELKYLYIPRIFKVASSIALMHIEYKNAMSGLLEK